MIRIGAAALLLGLIPARAQPAATSKVPGGFYRPPFQTPGARDSVWVEPFRLDVGAVTTRQYLAFLRRAPAWTRSRAKPLFVDSLYLASWQGDFDPPRDRLDQPVTEVSWFAAKAYCAERGARLPSTEEWERTARIVPPGVDSAAYTQKILDWYSQPASKQALASTVGFANAFGIKNLFGKIWEWTSDFNSVGPPASAAGAPLQSGAKGNGDTFFCGGAGQAAAAGVDYATFMRFAFRSSLKPNYAVGSLGFRCAQGE